MPDYEVYKSNVFCPSFNLKILYVKYNDYIHYKKDKIQEKMF